MFLDVVVQIRLRWWFKYLYLPCVIILSSATGLAINDEKFNYWLKKGTIIKITTSPIGPHNG